MSGRLPELWPQFAALAHAPMLAIRGENSDILSAKTLARCACATRGSTPSPCPARAMRRC